MTNPTPLPGHRGWLRPVLLGLPLLYLAIQALAGLDRFGPDAREWDWGHFYYAAEALTEGENPYRAGERGYIYPVTFAWGLQALVPLGFTGSAAVFLTLMSALSAVSVLLLDRTLREVGATPLAAAGAVCAAFVLLSDKFASTFKNGQTDPLLLICFVASLFASRRSAAATGLLLALAASVKYHALLFVFLFLLRGRWREAAWTVGGFVALLLAPALTLGWQTNVHYLGEAFGGVVNMVQDDPIDRYNEALPEAAELEPISWERSISLPSAFARLAESAGVSVAFGLALLAPVLAAAGGVAAAGYARCGRNPFVRDRALVAPAEGARLDLLEWSLVLTLLVAAAPQATARHFVFAWVPLASVLATGILAGPGVVRRWLVGGAIGFAIALNMPLSAYPALMDAWRSLSGASWALLALACALPFAYLPRLLPSDRQALWPFARS